MGNKTLIHLQCESSTNREIRIPEESTIQCLKTVEDPKKRLVIVAHKKISIPLVNKYFVNSGVLSRGIIL